MYPLLAVIESHLALAMTCVALALSLLALAIRPWRAGGERVLILGSGRLARKLIAELEACPKRVTIVGVVPEENGHPARYPVVGTIDNLSTIIAALGPERILVAMDQRRGLMPVGALLEARARGIAVEDGASAYERLARQLAIDSLTPSALIFSTGFCPRRLYVAAGRCLSLLVAAAGTVLSAPIGLLIVVLIRLDSPGRALFAQERVGLGGRKFFLLKFRTMRVDGATGSLWVGDNTARITRVGRWLRRFHLDELPQFINVLRGDMNLVGPRPHPLSNFDLFSASIPFYALRTFVRPGITGWAQVAYGYANNLEEETEKMRYDLYYIKRQSLSLDLRILTRTAGIFLTGSSTETRAAERNAAAPPISRAHRVA